MNKSTNKKGWSEVDHLLYEAHTINLDVTGVDVTKEEKALAKNKIKKIYDKIKSVDPLMYDILIEAGEIK